MSTKKQSTQSNPHPTSATAEVSSSAVIDYINSKGVLYDITISKPSFQTKLSFAELGLPDMEEMAMPAGMRLIDKSKLQPFQETESAIRNHLKRNSYDYFGGLRFIPWDLFPEVNDRIQAMLGEWKSKVEYFAEDYSYNRTNALDSWRKKAEEIWESSPALQSRSSKELYVGRVEKKINDHWPVESELRGRFAIHINVAQFKSGINAENVPSATVAAAQKQAMETANGFIKQAMGELRGRIVTLCSHVRDITINTGQIQEKSLQPIRDLIEKFQTLNWMDDKEAEKYLDELKNFMPDSDYLNGDVEAMEAFGAVLDSSANLIEDLTEEVVAQHIQEISGKGTRRLNI